MSRGYLFRCVRSDLRELGDQWECSLLRGRTPIMSLTRQESGSAGLVNTSEADALLGKVLATSLFVDVTAGLVGHVLAALDDHGQESHADRSPARRWCVQAPAGPGAGVPPGGGWRGGGWRGGGLPESAAATCGRARASALASGCGSPPSSSLNWSRGRICADRSTCCPAADRASASFPRSVILMQFGTWRARWIAAVSC